MATELDAALIAHFEACGLVTIEQLSQSVTIQAHRAPQRHTNLDVVVAQPAGASTGRDQLPRLTRSEKDVRPLAAKAMDFIFEAVQARCDKLTSDEKAERERKRFLPGATIHSPIKDWDYHNKHFHESYAEEKFVPTALNLYEVLCKAHTRNLLPNLNPNSTLKVVDLGCGPGSGLIAVEAFRQKLHLKSVEYTAVDNADWTLQLTASSRAEITDVDLEIWQSDLTKMNRNSWHKIGLADADLVICSYVHDVLESMLTREFLTKIVAKGACLLYVCPNHRWYPPHCDCSTTRRTDLGWLRYCNQRAVVYSKGIGPGGQRAERAVTTHTSTDSQGSKQHSTSNHKSADLSRAAQSNAVSTHSSEESNRCVQDMPSMWSRSKLTKCSKISSK